jgi:hypothetical protein
MESIWMQKKIKTEFSKHHTFVYSNTSLSKSLLSVCVYIYVVYVVHDLVAAEIRDGILPTRIVNWLDRCRWFLLLFMFCLLLKISLIEMIGGFSMWVRTINVICFADDRNVCCRGGAVALHAGVFYRWMYSNYSSIFLALTSPHTLGGVLALSTWLPLATTFPAVSQFATVFDTTNDAHRCLLWR